MCSKLNWAPYLKVVDKAVPGGYRYVPKNYYYYPHPEQNKDTEEIKKALAEFNATTA